MPPTPDAPATGRIRPTFEEEVRIAAGAVRGTIIELMHAIGANPNRPQAAARRLGMRPGLVWKVCKVAQETDSIAGLQHMPGSGGMKLFIDAAEAAGAPAELVARARGASDAFDEMVQTHTGDRRTLLTMLGQLERAEQGALVENDRKLAFQGNRAIWGVQVRTSATVAIIAPNAEAPDEVDYASVTGLFGFTRLRRSARWVLLRSIAYNTEGALAAPERRPIDPAVAGADDLPIIREFCANLPPIHPVRAGDELRFELREGAIGEAAAFDCVFGTYARRFASRFCTDVDQHGEQPAMLYVPAERHISDLYVHRDLGFVLPPEVELHDCLYTGIAGWPGPFPALLPLNEPVLDLGHPPLSITPHVPRYDALVARVFELLGHDRASFHGFRVEMPYPPIPTVLLTRFGLARR